MRPVSMSASLSVASAPTLAFVKANCGPGTNITQYVPGARLSKRYFPVESVEVAAIKTPALLHSVTVTLGTPGSPSSCWPSASMSNQT